MPSVEFELQRLPQYGIEFVSETWGKSNLPENGPSTMQLTGGKYALRCSGGDFNAVTLETADGLPVVSFGADGADIVQLEPGTYQVTIV
jgi:hypothetical protein